MFSILVYLLEHVEVSFYLKYKCGCIPLFHYTTLIGIGNLCRIKANSSTIRVYTVSLVRTRLNLSFVQNNCKYIICSQFKYSICFNMLIIQTWGQARKYDTCVQRHLCTGTVNHVIVAGHLINIIFVLSLLAIVRCLHVNANSSAFNLLSSHNSHFP